MANNSKKANNMNKSNVRPQVVAMKAFTSKNGEQFTKFVLSDGTQIMERGLYQVGKMMLIDEKGSDGKTYRHVYQMI